MVTAAAGAEVGSVTDQNLEATIDHRPTRMATIFPPASMATRRLNRVGNRLRRDTPGLARVCHLRRLRRTSTMAGIHMACRVRDRTVEIRVMMIEIGLLWDEEATTVSVDMARVAVTTAKEGVLTTVEDIEAHETIDESNNPICCIAVLQLHRLTERTIAHAQIGVKPSLVCRRRSHK